MPTNLPGNCIERRSGFNWNSDESDDSTTTSLPTDRQTDTLWETERERERDHKREKAAQKNESLVLQPPWLQGYRTCTFPGWGICSPPPREAPPSPPLHNLLFLFVIMSHISLTYPNFIITWESSQQLHFVHQSLTPTVNTRSLGSIRRQPWRRWEGNEVGAWQVQVPVRVQV